MLLTMNYTAHYVRLISRAKERLQPKCYTEKHHIIPRCMNGGDEIENIAVLTPEEHYVAHQLLVKIHPNHYGLICAARMMSMKRSGRSNKIYGWLKRRYVLMRAAARIKIPCSYCDTLYPVNPARQYSSKYCSHKCKSEARTGGVILSCKICSTTFHVCDTLSLKREYCSVACGNISKRSDTYCLSTCQCCKQEYRVLKINYNKRRFCSINCRRQSTYLKRSPTPH